MSELDHCLSELRNAAQSLAAVADSLTALFSGGQSDAQTVPPKQTAPPPAPEPKPPTLEQVRAVLADKSRAGHTAEVRALLEAHGVAKLSDIDPAEYPVLLVDASQIGLTEGSNG